MDKGTSKNHHDFTRLPGHAFGDRELVWPVPILSQSAKEVVAD